MHVQTTKGIYYRLLKYVNLARSLDAKLMYILKVTSLYNNKEWENLKTAFTTASQCCIPGNKFNKIFAKHWKTMKDHEWNTWMEVNRCFILA